ncbi:MAG: hypothetical protein A3F43_05260 [Gammaproteobacteria bacterium RIFCSPHIGHO2_12_FULL_42_10]|nr:MAG: hypothetical protein A3F43_05260 [Gammaproteobacteria bacterium RIFCSPHIGHO2_12_FULL_42_10]
MSGKKTCIGSIEKEFHFLGINYLGTQPSDDTNVTKVANHSGNQIVSAHYLNSLGGEDNAATGEQQPELTQIVPHARTLRKAREQVKLMVIDGVSPRRISSYLHRWAILKCNGYIHLTIRD